MVLCKKSNIINYQNNWHHVWNPADLLNDHLFRWEERLVQANCVLLEFSVRPIWQFVPFIFVWRRIIVYQSKEVMSPITETDGTKSLSRRLSVKIVNLWRFMFHFSIFPDLRENCLWESQVPISLQLRPERSSQELTSGKSIAFLAAGIWFSAMPQYATIQICVRLYS